MARPGRRDRQGRRGRSPSSPDCPDQPPRPAGPGRCPDLRSLVESRELGSAQPRYRWVLGGSVPAIAPANRRYSRPRPSSVSSTLTLGKASPTAFRSAIASTGRASARTGHGPAACAGSGGLVSGGWTSSTMATARPTAAAASVACFQPRSQPERAVEEEQHPTGGKQRWLSSTLLIELGLVITAGVVAIGLPVDGGGGRRYVVIALLAAALGLQNATVRRLAVPDLTTTVLTLTLTGLAADSWLAGARAPERGVAWPPSDHGGRSAGWGAAATGGRRPTGAGRGGCHRARRGGDGRRQPPSLPLAGSPWTPAREEAAPFAQPAPDSTSRRDTACDRFAGTERSRGLGNHVRGLL